MDFLVCVSFAILLILANLHGNFSSELKCPRKFHGITGHTACLPTSPNHIESKITEEEKRLIVDAHNKYRTMVKPPACTMFKMSWDDELAMVARKWAENCYFNHDPNFQRRIPGKYNVGQNLAHGYYTWEAAMEAWFNEYKLYNYGKLKHKGVVGHYTQMVWATSKRIGCYMANCKNMPRYYVCNYAPGGNFASEMPYQKCASGGRLKDCGNKVCYNDGKLNPTTCQCECKKHNFLYGPECKLNCTGTRDASMCSIRKSFCTVYSNIPDSCPWLCNMCPYATQTDAGKSLRPSLWLLLLVFSLLALLHR